MELNKLLKTDEVSGFLRISKRSLYRYIHSGDLKVYTIGNQYRLKMDDILQFLGQGLLKQAQQAQQAQQATTATTTKEKDYIHE